MGLDVHCRYQIEGGEDECYEAEQRLLREAGIEVDGYEHDNGGSSGRASCGPPSRRVWSRTPITRARALRAKRYDLVDVHNFFPLISPAVYHAAQAQGCAVIQTCTSIVRPARPGPFIGEAGSGELPGPKGPLAGVVHGRYRGTGPAPRGRGDDRRPPPDRHLAEQGRPLDRAQRFMRAKAIAGGLPHVAIKPNFVGQEPGRRRREGRLRAVHSPAPSREGRAGCSPPGSALAPHPLKIVGDGRRPTRRPRRGRNPALDYLGRRPLAEFYDCSAGRASSSSP